MGSCISKCTPQKNSQQDDDDHVQYECVKDKLVILQAPKPSNNSLSSSSRIELRKSICPSPPPSSSLASLSSFSSTSSSTTLSSSSSSSSSSASCFKDRSFSNDFLLSCAQEHDHILDINKKNKPTHCASHNQINMLTMSTTSSKKLYSRSSSSPLSKPPSPQRECTSTPKKRPRAKSPTMVRQKSLRKEHDHQQQQLKGTSCTYHPFPSTRTTILRSPSPSRRFPSNSKDDMKETSFRRSVTTKGNSGIISRSSSLRRDNPFKPTTPNNNEGKMKTNALKKVSPKIDEMEIIGEVKSNQDLDSLLMEDINNPLIALDCFIFL